VSSGSSSVFTRVFTVFEDDGVDDKEPGDTTTVDVQTIFVAFLRMSLKSACLNDECFFFFPGKKQNFPSWHYSLQVPNYQDFQIMGCQINLLPLEFYI